MTTLPLPEWLGVARFCDHAVSVGQESGAATPGALLGFGEAAVTVLAESGDSSVGLIGDELVAGPRGCRPSSAPCGCDRGPRFLGHSQFLAGCSPWTTLDLWSRGPPQHGHL